MFREGRSLRRTGPLQSMLRTSSRLFPGSSASPKFLWRVVLTVPEVVLQALNVSGSQAASESRLDRVKEHRRYTSILYHPKRFLRWLDRSFHKVRDFPTKTLTGYKTAPGRCFVVINWLVIITGVVILVVIGKIITRKSDPDDIAMRDLHQEVKDYLATQRAAEGKIEAMAKDSRFAYWRTHKDD